MEILKKPIVIDIVAEILYMLLIIAFFACFNTQAIMLENTVLIKYIDISSITFLGIAIIMLEVGFRKNKSKIFANGIEFIILAIATLLIKHIPKTLGYSIEKYTEKVAYIFSLYYVLKTAVIYTKYRYKQLQDLSDIKEIVKDEPVKKASKRKNKKVEEGK